jgi:hypothetical protein
MMRMRAKGFQGCKEAVERPGQAQQGSRNQSQKSEIRNPKQIQIGGEREMRKTGGRGKRLKAKG